MPGRENQSSKRPGSIGCFSLNQVNARFVWLGASDASIYLP